MSDRFVTIPHLVAPQITLPTFSCCAFVRVVSSVFCGVPHKPVRDAPQRIDCSGSFEWVAAGHPPAETEDRAVVQGPASEFMPERGAATTHNRTFVDCRGSTTAFSEDPRKWRVSKQLWRVWETTMLQNVQFWKRHLRKRANSQRCRRLTTALPATWLKSTVPGSASLGKRRKSRLQRSS